MHCNAVVILTFTLALIMLILPVQEWAGVHDVIFHIIPLVILLLQIFRDKHNYSIHFSNIDLIVLGWIAYTCLLLIINNRYPQEPFVVSIIPMVTLYIGLRQFFSKTYNSDLFGLCIITSFAIFECVYGVSQFFQDGSNDFMFTLTGTFQNSGPYAAILSIGVISDLVLLREWVPRNKRCICGILYAHIAVCTIFMIIVQSRTAILGSVAGLVLLYWKKAKSYRRLLIITIIAVVPILLAVKWGSAKGRLMIYSSAVLSILKSPIIGHGIGSFYHQFAERVTELHILFPNFDFSAIDVIYNAYNDMLHIGVEQGCIGICFATSLCMKLHNGLKWNDSLSRQILISLICISMFSYPFELRPFQTILVLMAAYTASLRVRYTIHYSKRYHTMPLLGICCLIIIVLSFYSFFFLQNHLIREKKAQTLYHNWDCNNIQEYEKLMPHMEADVTFLFYYAQKLTECKRYEESNTIAHKGTLVSNDPVFYISQGDNFKCMGKYNDAEKSYIKAFHVMPNRLYPLFCLMTLYGDMANDKKQIEIANEIINLHPKIKSSATDEIKKEAMKVLNAKHK